MILTNINSMQHQTDLACTNTILDLRTYSQLYRMHACAVYSTEVRLDYNKSLTLLLGMWIRRNQEQQRCHDGQQTTAAAHSGWNAASQDKEYFSELVVVEKYEFQSTIGQDVPSRAHAWIFSREIHFHHTSCIADMAIFTALMKFFFSTEISAILAKFLSSENYGVVLS